MPDSRAALAAFSELELVEAARSLADFLHKQLGTREECVSIVKKCLPEWDGIFDGAADLDGLVKLYEQKYPRSAPLTDCTQIPEELGKAWVGLIVYAVENDIIETVQEYFGGLNIFQSAIRLWEIFSQSVNAKRKGGRATAKWNPRIHSLATSMVSQLIKTGVPRESAYRRTSARLNQEHGISISASTLKRRLSRASNAKR